VNGALRGTLSIGNHAKVYLVRGLAGRLDTEEASHADLFLGTPMDAIDIERLPGSGAGSSCTLHVPASDLGVGEHENVGRWPKVVVGGAYWRDHP
jgi:hypothetical protein